MKLLDCDLNITAIVTRPLIKAEPEEEWIEAKKAGTVPPALYRFYSGANYFSFRESPRFLLDSEKLLFPYIGSLVRGLFESLCQADELTKEIAEAHDKTYTPLKKAKGKSWDRKADIRALRCFKYLLVELNGATDQFAEIVAVYFYGELSNLPPGRSSFEALKEFALKPLGGAKKIVSPRLPLLERLHSSLRFDLVREGEEKEWYELMLLYRNKLAHLGNAMFIRMSFPQKGGDMFSFLPNRWPLIFEAGITTADEHSEGNIEEFAIENLVHQDIVEYSQHLVGRTRQMLNSGFEVLCDAHTAFADYDVNDEVLRSIRKHSRAYDFRAFRNIDGHTKTT